MIWTAQSDHAITPYPASWGEDRRDWQCCSARRPYGDSGQWAWGRPKLMSQNYVGQIIPVGFNFAPVGWVLCNGQLLPISEYATLFNLIGTTYGGDGVQTFAVPNLCGR